MLIFRHIVTIGTGVLLVLICGRSATSRVSPQLTSQPESSVEVAQTNEPQPEPSSETQEGEIAPVTPTQISPDTTNNNNSPAPDFLNPSANPLLFPTESEEVNIETIQPISLDGAIELALRNNKDLQQAKVQLERRQAEREEALAALFPTLDAQLELRQEETAQSNLSQRSSGGFFENFNPGGTDNTEFNGRIELNYNIYTGDSRSANIRRAEKEIRRSELDVERLVQQTRFDATDAYYNLQNADAQVAIAQAAVEDATQSLRDANLLEQAGLGTRFDVLRAEVDLASANQSLTQAIADQRIARRRMVQVLSLGQQVELTAADEIKEAGEWQLSLDDSIVLAYKNRAELEQELLQREIAEQQRTIALADTKPQVSVFANYQFLDDLQDDLSPEDGYQLGARMSWQFFDGGRASARANQAEKDKELAETRFAQQREQIRLQVEEAYFNLTANKENIQTTRKNVERAEESLRLARLRFQAGVGTQTDVINAQRDLTEARSQFLQAIIGYNQSLNALQRAVSNLPDNRLFEQP